MTHWILLNAPDAAQHHPGRFWRLTPAVLKSLRPGFEVQLRAIEHDEVEGAHFWDNIPIWVRLHKVTTDECRGEVTSSSIEVEGFRRGDAIAFGMDRIFDVWDPDAAPREQPNRVKARFLRGKDIVVGLTYLKRDGRVDHRSQFHGTIVIAGFARGVVISRDDARDFFTLPPDLRSIQPARPGIYRLKPSGHKVEDPLFESTWTITASE
jgi:hypothetical protein